MAKARQSVNVTRMSIAVHANLENDEGGNGYTAATVGEGREEVQLHNADAELDFQEHIIDEGAIQLLGSHLASSQMLFCK